MGVAFALSVLFLPSACATGGSTPVEHAAFHSLGSVDGRDLDEAVRRVLVRDCGFSLARRSRQFATVYYETRWKERSPLPEEVGAGVTRARTRLVIRGPRVSDGSYRALLEGENEIRTDSVRHWSSAPVPGAFVAWTEAMAERLRGGGPSPVPSDSTAATPGCMPGSERN